MKSCSKCKLSRSLDDFYEEKRAPDGLTAACKICIRKQRVEFNANNPERRREANKRYRDSHALSFYAVKRVADQLKRTPKWLSLEDLDSMKKMYSEAREISLIAGIPHEVDHMIPLRGKLVSGLHVPWNLRITTRSENRKKNNKHEI